MKPYTNKPLRTIGRRFKIVYVLPVALTQWFKIGMQHKITEGLPSDVIYIESWFNPLTECLVLLYESPSWPLITEDKPFDQLEEIIITTEAV